MFVYFQFLVTFFFEIQHKNHFLLFLVWKNWVSCTHKIISNECQIYASKAQTTEKYAHVIFRKISSREGRMFCFPQNRRRLRQRKTYRRTQSRITIISIHTENRSLCNWTICWLLDDGKTSLLRENWFVAPNTDTQTNRHTHVYLQLCWEVEERACENTYEIWGRRWHGHSHIYIYVLWANV